MAPDTATSPRMWEPAIPGTGKEPERSLVISDSNITAR